VKHSAALDRWYVASAKASDTSRQLAFAGIAVVWVLSGGADAPTTATVSGELVGALLAFVVALLCDFLQYAVQSLLWRMFSRKKEKALRAQYDSAPGWRDEEFSVPVALNVPGEVFFWSKLVAVATGYVVLGSQLVHRLT
jgi:hypothetical protein